MFAGIDGCREGWVVVLAPGWPLAAPPETLLLRTFAEVLAAVEHCALVGLDMPVGLPSGPEVRRCDIEARTELARMAGPEVRAVSSRVFAAPPRETLGADSPDEFQRLHRLARGVGAGLPVWGIAPKLREVDRAMTPALQQRVIEVHPELTFARLAGRALPSKHTAQGLAVRRALVCAGFAPPRPGAPDGARGEDCPWPPKRLRCGAVAARADDLLDAAACLAAAAGAKEPKADARRLPRGATKRDAHGLRMEIWY